MVLHLLSFLKRAAAACSLAHLQLHATCMPAKLSHHALPACLGSTKVSTHAAYLAAQALELSCTTCINCLSLVNLQNRQT